MKSSSKKRTVASGRFNSKAKTAADRQLRLIIWTTVAVLVIVTTYITSFSPRQGWQNNHVSLSMVTPSLAHAILPTPTNTPTNPETGWRIFRYDSTDRRNLTAEGVRRSEIPRVSYTVEYPPDWTVETGLDQETSFGVVVFYAPGDRGNTTSITIEGDKGPAIYTPDFFLTNYPSDDPAITQDSIMLPAGAAVRETIRGELNVLPTLGGLIQRVYLQQANNISYLFELNQPPGDNNTRTFSRVLSTFRPSQ